MASYNTILSGVSRYGRAAETAANRILTSIGVGDDTTSSAIRDKILGGFLGDTNQFHPNVFSRLFDEPTYLTFRIEFNFSPSYDVNFAHVAGTHVPYDYLPEPFLAYPKDTYQKISSQWIDESGSSETYSGIDENGDQIFEPVLRRDNMLSETDNSYSTYDYLMNRKSETKRAHMLNVFIQSLKDIQDNYPYYFQSVDGLGDLMKINPSKGIRMIDGENNIITIKCLEGLDMKITQLMQLYRKIVWDDYYQRWVLPDMMRYFSMKIYISEIRLFHSGSSYKTKHKKPKGYGNIAESLNATSADKIEESKNILGTVNEVLNDVTALTSEILGTNSTVTNIANAVGQTHDTLMGLGTNLSSDYYRLCNNAINDVMPTICFECHQCEFVIDDTLSYLGSISASTKDNKPVEPSLKIKVGKLIDRQIYPLNKVLQEKEAGVKYTIETSPDKDFMQGVFFNDDSLRKPIKNANNENFSFNENDNNTNISKTTLRVNQKYFDANKSQDLSYRPLQPNAKVSGMSLLKGVLTFFTQDEARSAATTIDTIKTFIYDRDDPTNPINSVATSDENKNKLSDKVFVETLDNIVKSKATDGETALSALSEHILDSLATNGELKIKK